jgi:hypothetical protein
MYAKFIFDSKIWGELIDTKNKLSHKFEESLFHLDFWAGKGTTLHNHV